jgi:hypothetical protein
MKIRKWLTLIGVFLILGSMMACGSPAAETTTPAPDQTSAAQLTSAVPAETPNQSTTTPTAVSPGPSGETSLLSTTPSLLPDLSEEEKLKMWEERGSYTAETIEEASRFVGYEVIEPAFIPDSFRKSSFIMINRLGGGLPEELRPKSSPINVEQIWYWEEDRTVIITLVQSQNKFGMGGDQSQVEIGGREVTRSVTLGEPPTPNVAYAWEKDGVYYSLYGRLEGPLDEATMEKVLVSMF